MGDTRCQRGRVPTGKGSVTKSALGRAWTIASGRREKMFKNTETARDVDIRFWLFLLIFLPCFFVRLGLCCGVSSEESVWVLSFCNLYGCAWLPGNRDYGLVVRNSPGACDIRVHDRTVKTLRKIYRLFCYALVSPFRYSICCWRTAIHPITRHVTYVPVAAVLQWLPLLPFPLYKEMSLSSNAVNRASSQPSRQSRLGIFSPLRRQAG